MRALVSHLRNRVSRREDRSDRFSEPTIEVTDAGTTTTTTTTTTTAPGAAVPGSGGTVADSNRSLPLLFNLCRRWAWPAIEWRCRSHPHEADAQDHNGDTALHWVVFGRPPVEAVQALIDACPELASRRNLAGKLPIQVAVSYRASGDVLWALAEACPEGAAGVLHTACDVGCSVDGIRALANERSVVEVDATYRQTPLEMLNARKHMGMYHARVERLRQARHLQTIRGRGDAEGWRRFEAEVREMAEEWEFFNKAAILIQVEYRNRRMQKDEDEMVQIVHACAGISNCPPSLLELAMLLYPEQLLEQDEQGQVPLHKAARNFSCRDVVLACPQAAKICDREGKYALETAVARGQRWNHGVGTIVAAHPQVVEGLDLDERMYPLLWSKLSRDEQTTATPLYLSIRSKPSLFGAR